MLAAGDLPHLSSMIEPRGPEPGDHGLSVHDERRLSPLSYRVHARSLQHPLDPLARPAHYRGRWWQDREAIRSYCGYQAPRLDGDIAPDVSTIFELVPESVGIFTPIARGLTPARDPSRLERQLWGSVAHFALWHQPSDDAVSRHLLRAVDRGWRFVFAQFPAVDGYTHQTTPDAEPVRRALEQVDATVGAVRERLARRGELESTLILVVSDHGATVVRSHLDLAGWFRARGIPTLVAPGHLGAQSTRGRDGRRQWLGDGLREAERAAGSSVARGAAPEPGGVRVGHRCDRATDAGTIGRFGSGGERAWWGLGRKRERERAPVPISRPVSPTNPSTATRSTSAVLGRRRCARGSRRRGTRNFPTPCFIFMDQFRAGRTGDLVVVAREGYDFRQRFEIPEHKAGHGSLIRAHMQTPIWASEALPGIALRTVDLFPAMLDWLEVDVPDARDGEPVWLPRSRLRKPRGPASIPVAQHRIPSSVR